MGSRITLGQKVKDTITGFEGIAIARTIWLHGCERILVQPPYQQDSDKMPEHESFDEPQLEIIGTGVSGIELKPKEKRPCGDPSFVPTRH